MKKVLLVLVLLVSVHAWEKTIDITQMDEANDIIQMPDGSFAICGVNTTISHAYADIAVARLNEDGDTIWYKLLGTDESDIGYELVCIDDTSFVIVGTSMEFGYRYLSRINLSGDTIWTLLDGESIKGFNVDLNYEGNVFTGGGDLYIIYSPFGDRLRESYMPFYPYRFATVNDTKCLHSRPYGYVSAGRTGVEGDDVAALALYTEEGDTAWTKFITRSD